MASKTNTIHEETEFESNIDVTSENQKSDQDYKRKFCEDHYELGNCDKKQKIDEEVSSEPTSELNPLASTSSKNNSSKSIVVDVSHLNVLNVDNEVERNDTRQVNVATDRCEKFIYDPKWCDSSSSSPSENGYESTEFDDSDPFEEEEENLIEFAVESNKISLTTFLLDNGADPNTVKQNIGTDDRHKLEFILHAACKKGFNSIVEVLIEYKADIQVLNHDSQNALHIAANCGNYELCQILVKNGCDMNCEDKDGRLPLHFAVKNLDIAKLLIDHGSNLNHVDYDGYTPLLEACAEGNLKTVEYLLNKGVDVSITDGEKRTALMISCSRADSKIVNCLLKSSISINATSVSGMTALHNAASAHNGTHVIKELIEFGCKLNPRDMHGWTPLIYSIQMIRPKSVKTLLLANCPFKFTINMLNRFITPFQLCLLQLEQMTLFSISEQKYCAVNDLFIILRMLLSVGVDAIPPPKPLHTGLDKVTSCSKSLSEKGYGFHAIDTTEILKYCLNNPHRLTLLSRKVIRECFCKDIEIKIKKLKLPPLIQNYILLTEFDSFLED